MYFDEGRIPLFVLILPLANLVIVLAAYICCGISGDIAFMCFGVLIFTILLILANLAIALVTYICGDITEEIAVRIFAFLFYAMILVLLVRPIL